MINNSSMEVFRLSIGFDWSRSKKSSALRLFVKSLKKSEIKIGGRKDWDPRDLVKSSTERLRTIRSGQSLIEKVVVPRSVLSCANSSKRGNI